MCLLRLFSLAFSLLLTKIGLALILYFFVIKPALYGEEIELLQHYWWMQPLGDEKISSRRGPSGTCARASRVRRRQKGAASREAPRL